jgi:hypothetical protein
LAKTRRLKAGAAVGLAVLALSACGSGKSSSAGASNLDYSPVTSAEFGGVLGAVRAVQAGVTPVFE